MRKLVVGIASILLVLIVAATLGMVFGGDEHKAIRAFVESRYTPEIRLLESSMREIQIDQIDDVHFQDSMKERLCSSFSAPEFFEVMLCDDGHHTHLAIKTTRIGLSYQTPFLFRPDFTKEQHRVFKGNSFAGDRLIIYQGWLPDTPVVHQYELIFYESQILKLMASQNN